MMHCILFAVRINMGHLPAPPSPIASYSVKLVYTGMLSMFTYCSVAVHGYKLRTCTHHLLKLTRGSATHFELPLDCGHAVPPRFCTRAHQKIRSRCRRNRRRKVLISPVAWDLASHRAHGLSCRSSAAENEWLRRRPRLEPRCNRMVDPRELSELGWRK
jgi:hypothetical protein